MGIGDLKYDGIIIPNALCVYKVTPVFEKIQKAIWKICL